MCVHHIGYICYITGLIHFVYLVLLVDYIKMTVGNTNS